MKQSIAIDSYEYFNRFLGVAFLLSFTPLGYFSFGYVVDNIYHKQRSYEFSKYQSIPFESKVF